MAKQRYNLAHIRELLTEGFSERELRHLCDDLPGFQKVYAELPKDVSKADAVDAIIGFAERYMQLDVLLALAKERNPARYQEHGPYLMGEAAETPSRPAVPVAGLYHSCFISYSHQDEAFVQQLYTDLQKNEVRCWYAPESLKIGDKLRQTIDQAIQAHAKLLIVLSANSIASDWVEGEVEAALEEEGDRKQVMLFPIRLDEEVMKTSQAWAAYIRRTRYIGDFSRWQDSDAYQKALQRLLRDLKAE